MLLDPEPLPDQALEVARQIVGQEERARLLIHHLLEVRRAGEPLIAVRPLDPLHALFGENAVQLAPGAAIAIEHEDAVELLPPGSDLAPDPRRDLFRPVVPDRGQAGDLHPVVPATRLAHRQEFLGQCAAGDEQGLWAVRHTFDPAPPNTNGPGRRLLG